MKLLYCISTLIILLNTNVFGQITKAKAKQTKIDSLNTIIKEGTDTAIAWSYYRLAELYRETGSEEDYNLGNSIAVQCHSFSKDVLLRSEQPEIRYSLHKLLGKVSRLLVNTYSWFQINEQLEIYFKDCIAHYDTIKNVSEKCKCIRDLGRYYMVNGKQDLGKEYYNEVIKIEREENDSVELSISLTSLAHLYYRNGNLVEARQLIDESIKILYGIKDYKTVVLMLNQSGLIYKSEGDYLSASSHFYKALEISDSTGNKVGKATTLNNLGHLFIRYENYKQALFFSKQALEINQKINHKQGISYAYNQIAVAYFELKEFDKALMNYRHCLKILNEFGRIEDIARLKLNLASIYLKLDSLNNAESLYDEVFEIIDKIKNNSILVQAKIGRGKLYFKQGKTNIALSEAIGSEKLLREINDINESRKVEKLLSDIYTKKKNWQASLIHFKNYVELNDSIVNIKALRKTILKDAEYRVKKNKDSTHIVILLKENEILENKTKINFLKQEKRVKTLTVYGVFIGCLLILIIAFLWFKSFKKNKEFKEIEMQRAINLKIQEINLLQSTLKTQSEERASLKTNILSGNINAYLSNPLSKRELEVLEELTKGKDNKVIAENLFLSVNTVRTHLAKIYEKLDVKNRLQAVNKASNIQMKSK